MERTFWSGSAQTKPRNQETNVGPELIEDRIIEVLKEAILLASIIASSPT